MSAASPFSSLLPDLFRTVARFPACVAAAIALCIVNNIDAANSAIFGNAELWRINYALLAAFLAGGTGHLIGISHKLRAFRSMLAGLGLSLLACALTYFEAVSGAHPLFILCGLTLALMVSAHLRPGVAQSAIWLFNSRLALAAILSVVAGVCFSAGLSAIVESLEYLFNIHLSRSAHDHIWVTGISLIGPVYGLSLVPDDLEENFALSDEHSLLERGITIMINYVLVPVAITYMVILHLYAAKIVWTWQLPKGQIGTMVMYYGLGTAAIYLIARPWIERGTKVLQWFLAYWFWFIITPSALLAIAVWKRVSDYGVTQERYGLFIILAWLLVLVMYVAARRARTDSRIILGTLLLLLVLASFGPWGAREVSLASQLGRLTAILEDGGYLKGGKLIANIPEFGAISPERSFSALSIMRFLHKEGEISRLATWYDGRDQNPFKAFSTSRDLLKNISRQLRIADAKYPQPNRESIYFNALRPQDIPIKEKALLSGPHQLEESYIKGVPEENPLHVAARLNAGHLFVRHGGRYWQVSTLNLLKKAKIQQSSSSASRKLLRLEVKGDGGTVVLLFQRISGTLKKETTSNVAVTFWIILPAT